MTPDELLVAFKDVERTLGRRKTIDNGPREIDLDILFYDERSIQLPHLVVPHARIAEREFVLRPLVECVSLGRESNIDSLAPDLVHLGRAKSAQEMLGSLMRSGASQLERVVPLQSSPSVRSLDRISPVLKFDRTLVMGIMNVTPDSFSDGGDHVEFQNALRVARQMLDDGADIIDIGGCSTRPGAEDPGAEVEIERVVALVKALSAARPDSLISIDTFRASVARAAVEAGADIVNDVSGGLHDPDMFAAVAELNVPYVLMHMRGDAQSMTSLTHYDGGVVKSVATELRARIAEAERAGIRRWNLIVDPGIGFAKDVGGNVDLIAGLARFLGPDYGLQGYPCLVGASRKRFLGRITGRDDYKELTHATLAAHTMAIAGGASIIRAHDVAAAVDAAKVADAIRIRQLPADGFR